MDSASGGPPAFVELLFDQYAPRFERSLVDKLAYRGPALILERLQANGFTRAQRALDLGCGTGLMGEVLRPLCTRLEGIDLSGEMLRQARAKGIYDRLEKADIAALDLGAERADQSGRTAVRRLFLVEDGEEGGALEAAVVLLGETVFERRAEQVYHSLGPMEPTPKIIVLAIGAAEEGAGVPVHVRGEGGAVRIRRAEEKEVSSAVRLILQRGSRRRNTISTPSTYRERVMKFSLAPPRAAR